MGNDKGKPDRTLQDPRSGAHYNIQMKVHQRDGTKRNQLYGDFAVIYVNSQISRTSEKQPHDGFGPVKMKWKMMHSRCV